MMESLHAVSFTTQPHPEERACSRLEGRGVCSALWMPPSRRRYAAPQDEGGGWNSHNKSKGGVR